MQTTIHYSKKKVFYAVKIAAKKLNLEINSASFENGTLALFANGGLFSYGNEIDVTVEYSEPSKSILKIVSRSSSAIQLVDWGTNKNLESNLIDEVKNILN